MRHSGSRWITLLLTAVLAVAARATEFSEIDSLWKQAMAALRAHEPERARTLAGDFNQQVRSYLHDHPPTWQLKYMAGTLYCQFPDSRPRGAQLLEDLIQNNRELNSEGKDFLRGLLKTCQSDTSSAAPGDTPDSWEGMVRTSAHVQTPGPGVSGYMKGGYNIDFQELARSNSGAALVPIPAAALQARLVSVGNPMLALNNAYGRLPHHGAGAPVGAFAVVTSDSDPAAATGIGRCLTRYLDPLGRQFQIQPPEYMITVYQTRWVDQVYDYGQRLHGLILPLGVVAYSVPEDMSMTGLAGPNTCGTMAHELVHLLIRRSYPMSPAWLEEGLASEVAVAQPTPDRFRFAPSWRDETLQQQWSLRPRVADLLELPWADFTARSRDQVPRAAAIQAMAAAFIRYLDARGKLVEVYFAARDEHISADLSEVRSYREIVEMKLGQPVEQIDRDFENWFRRRGVPRAEPGSHGGNSADSACMNAPMAQQGCAPLIKKSIDSQ